VKLSTSVQVSLISGGYNIIAINIPTIALVQASLFS
jgi:hypothetical protein